MNLRYILNHVKHQDGRKFTIDDWNRLTPLEQQELWEAIYRNTIATAVLTPLLQFHNMTRFFDTADPTNRNSYVDSPPVFGLPLNWRDDQSGIMGHAIMAYLNQCPSDEQLSLVIAYVKHYVHAPVWIETRPEHITDPIMDSRIAAIREKALTLKTMTDVNNLVAEAAEIGLDPF